MTYEFKGAKRVHVRLAGGGSSEKRFATLWLCVAMGTDQPVGPTLIFQGTGQRISDEERSEWHPAVHVIFQPRAWADRPTAEEWAKEHVFPSLNDAAEKDGHLPNWLMFLDNLDSQSCADFRRLLLKNGVRPWFTVPDTTDCTQASPPQWRLRRLR
jgi:hypothetical protein